MYFLAVDYGAYEGWKLTEFRSAEEMLEAVKSGLAYGQPFKILKELKLKAKDESV